tara:strand:+ start:35 stop:877 length:843 start_codon:yes stop_codon:yes gene_type:complete
MILLLLMIVMTSIVSAIKSDSGWRLTPTTVTFEYDGKEGIESRMRGSGNFIDGESSLSTTTRGRFWHGINLEIESVPEEETVGQPSGGGGSGNYSELVEEVTEYCQPGYLSVYNPITLEYYCVLEENLSGLIDSDLLLIVNDTLVNITDYLNPESLVEEEKIGLWSRFKGFLSSITGWIGNLFRGEDGKITVVEKTKQVYDNTSMWMIIGIFGVLILGVLFYLFGGYMWGAISYILSMFLTIVTTILATGTVFWFLIIIAVIIILAAKGVFSLGVLTGGR